LIVVYDAEDRPEPDQLRKAAAVFAASDQRVIGLQAQLAPDNWHETFLARMFALDFCQWFDFMLPGFSRLGLPIPLGGSSNHFRRRQLIDAGGWDEWNVTEDADLGMRLRRLGFGVKTLNSTTYEEAPLTLDQWLPQRTRWARGYMQTFLVHTRAPQHIGLPALTFPDRFFLIAFTGGSIIFALINPVFWSLVSYAVLTGEPALDWLFGPVVGSLAWNGLVIGNGLLFVITALSPLRRGWRGLSLWALAIPINWALVSFASWRALYMLLLNPFHWEKTQHGLSRGRTPQP
jgi:cellulose synthase/poly-beta-1,6-N-acetylglucosamine synthase-like glycosyltransferase